MKTEVKYFNQTIAKYTNLIFFNNNFYFVNNNERLKSIPLSVGFFFKYKYTNKDVKFKPIKLLNYKPKNLVFLDKIVFFNEDECCGHVGHTIFDSIASQFSCLKICNIDLNANTNIITLQQINDGLNEQKYHDVLNSYQLLFGNKKIYLDEFGELYKNKHVCIKTLICGSSKKGVSYYNTECIAYNGYLNSWNDFRDYCYLRSDIDLSIENTNILYSSTKYDTQRGDRIIQNDEDVCIFVKNNNGVVIKWIDCPDLQEQIKLLSTVKYYISIDGTNGLNSILLRTNSIFINLGIKMFKPILGTSSMYDGIGYVDNYVYPACSFNVIYYFDNCLKIPQEQYICIKLLKQMIDKPEKYLSVKNYSKCALNTKNIFELFDKEKQNHILFNLLTTDTLASNISLIGIYYKGKLDSFKSNSRILDINNKEIYSYFSS